MSLAVDSTNPAADDELLRYRALSPAAVVSLVLGVLSIFALFAPALELIPFLGVATGVYAWRRIRRMPEELTGLGMARTGIVLSIVLAITGWSWQAYVYAHEVPPGYQRISYDDLQPNSQVPGETVPDKAKELSGRRVFLKGYVHPSSFEADAKGIHTFVLCRDNGTCCFGGQPKLTDMVKVKLTDPLRLEYTPQVHRVAGVFQVEPTTVDKLGGVVYHLSADYLQ